MWSLLLLGEFPNDHEHFILAASCQFRVGWNWMKILWGGCAAAFYLKLNALECAKRYVQNYLAAHSTCHMPRVAVVPPQNWSELATISITSRLVVDGVVGGWWLIVMMVTAFVRYFLEGQPLGSVLFLILAQISAQQPRVVPCPSLPRSCLLDTYHATDFQLLFSRNWRQMSCNEPMCPADRSVTTSMQRYYFYASISVAFGKLFSLRSK